MIDYQNTVRHWSNNSTRSTSRLEEAMETRAKEYLSDCAFDNERPTEKGMLACLEAFSDDVQAQLEEDHDWDDIKDAAEAAATEAWREYKVNRVLDHCAEFGSADFLNLGLAALDQAGLPASLQRQISRLLEEHGR